MEENYNQKDLEKELELRNIFSDMLSVLSLTLNDSVKWRKEHERVSFYLDIRNKELQDIYDNIKNIKEDIKQVLDNIKLFIETNKYIIKNEIGIDNLLLDITEKLDKHKPYVTIEEKEKQEQEKKKNCTSC